MAIQLRKGCGNEFLLLFFVFGAFHFPVRNPSKKGFKIVFFSALAPRYGFEAGFGQEKLRSCQRNAIESFGFCNLMLANRTEAAASQLLCIAAPQVVHFYGLLQLAACKLH